MVRCNGTHDDDLEMGDNEFMGINKYNSIGTNGRDEK